MTSGSKSNAFYIHEKRQTLALEAINEALREASQPSQGLCLPIHEEYPPVAGGLYKIATAVMTTENINDLNKILQDIYKKLAADKHVTQILYSRGLDGGVFEQLTEKLPTEAGIAERIERAQAIHDCLAKFVSTFDRTGMQLRARSR